VAELRKVEDKEHAWRIGAQVSLTEVEELVADAYPDFAEVLRRFGSPPIRSTATLAGNIANGSPIGDSMPCLLALGATLHLRRGEKIRHVAMESFYTGQKQNVLKPGEFIEAIELPQARARPSLPRAQGQQALRAGHLGHLLRLALPRGQRRAQGCPPGLQRTDPPGRLARPKIEGRARRAARRAR
jgi:CO/xanthine dehydrogenase FAD-binding subunit